VKEIAGVMGSVLLGILPATAPATSAHAMTATSLAAATCSVSVDSPHYSKSGNTIVAKARFSCPSGASRTWHINDFVLYHDGGAAWENGRMSDVKLGSGQSTTRYVPPSGKRVPRAKGRWFASLYYYLGSDPEAEYRKDSPTAVDP
jgi:hypothetical protein